MGNSIASGAKILALQRTDDNHPDECILLQLKSDPQPKTLNMINKTDECVLVYSPATYETLKGNEFLRLSPFFKSKSSTPDLYIC